MTLDNRLVDCSVAIEWKPGARHAARAVVSVNDPRLRRTVVYEPEYEFFMLGLGYGHPKWTHGMAHGELTVEREDMKLADIDVRQMHHLHVQAVCKVTLTDDAGSRQIGRGVFEQLVIGPHAPSGFNDVMDVKD